MRGRPAERSDWGCPERVWPAVRAPWRLGARYWHRASAQETHDQLFNGLPAGSETERGASSPERRGAEASPLRSGHRGRALWTCSDATAVPASSGQKAGRHRCRAAQSPFGSAGPPAALPIPRQRHRVSSRLCPRLPGSSRRQQHLPPSLTPLHLLIRCLQDFYLPWATPRRAAGSLGGHVVAVIGADICSSDM